MRVFFAATLSALTLLSLVAWRLAPRPPAGKTRLVWVSDDNPVRRGQIALFNKLNPHYDLAFDPTGGMEKIMLQCLAGVGPDLFDARNPGELDAFVRSGVAWDVTDELAKRGIDLERDVWPAILPYGVRDGRVYGFPGDICVDAIWFHKDLFDRAGEPYPTSPWTWQQFLEVAQRMVVRDKRGRIVQFGFLCEWWQWPQFIMWWGGALYTPDGARCIVDSPEAIAGIQFLHDLMYKYHVMPTPVDDAAMAGQGGFATGNVRYLGARKGAMALGGRWWLCVLRDYEGMHLGAVASPRGPGLTLRAYGRATLVNKYSPRREQALKFLEYLAGPGYNNLINQQADGIAAVKRYCYTPEFLHDPRYPQENYNQVWRDVVKYARCEETSPFVDGQVAMRVMEKQLDLVRNDQKPVPEAMRDAARGVNDEIAKALDRDPSLRLRYYRLTHKQRPD
jgi:multiple sugar transport system substrate-binding protein